MTTKVTKRKDGTVRVSYECDSESKVEQQHQNDADINTIMRKLHSQGVLPYYKNGGDFGDFTSVEDFHEAQNKIAQARLDFMALPAVLRQKFNNDPGELIQFLDNPDNLAEAREMGLVSPERPETDNKATKPPTEGNEPGKAPVASEDTPSEGSA